MIDSILDLNFVGIYYDPREEKIMINIMYEIRKTYEDIDAIHRNRKNSFNCINPEMAKLNMFNHSNKVVELIQFIRFCIGKSYEEVMFDLKIELLDEKMMDIHKIISFISAK